MSHGFDIDYVSQIDTVHFVRKLNESPKERTVINGIIRNMTHILKKSLDRKISVITEDQLMNLPDVSVFQFPLIVSIGGDGTALYGMKLSAQASCPLLTINLGRLGFLADLSPDDIFEEVHPIFNKMLFQLERRIMLECNGHIAANEFFVGPPESGKVFHYKVYVNGVLASTQEADGVIVSSPTGTTAYALSSGGAILSPEMQAIQIIPVSPHTLTSRPLVVKFDSQVTIKYEGAAILRGDGRKLETFDKSGSVIVSRYGNRARVLHPKDWSFYSVLNEKLAWNL